MHSGQVMYCAPSLLKIFASCFLTDIVEKYARSIDLYLFLILDHYFMPKVAP